MNVAEKISKAPKMTLDDALRLFNEEIDRTEKELYFVRETSMNLRRSMLESPITSKLQMESLRIKEICIRELLDCLKRSREVLLHEMIDRYL